ncbi:MULTISPECIES: IS110 family transposase [Microvirga]|uniref:IS110 family transposase n=1 Tax=Microvirga TaxID=186650 RepID=UPI001B39336C|nr:MULTISPECIES: IS110 family transposase [unclassified Microvirga]MBQ0819253.1 IS110 family transposase [Microvirga sp. HBU67558]
MSHQTTTEAVATIGIDLGKNTFHLIGMDARGRILLRRKVSRGQLQSCMANLPACLIGMEACAGAHHVGRQLAALGHDVRLLPVQYVKPFLKGHKNDYRDAEAIAEAVQRPTMRPVPLKSAEQLDLQALHRVRRRRIGQRTAVINQIRAFLLECGLPVRQGLAGLREALPTLLSQRTDVLSPRMIHLIEDLSEDWRQLDERIETLTRDITALAREDVGCRRLMDIPGIGVITASAMVAAVGTGAAFAKGRDFAAWLGLVPKQISTGNRTILGGLSKRGNRYLRTLFVGGAQAILQHPHNWQRHRFGDWLTAAGTRLHRNVLAAALANKLARIAWSVLYRERGYDVGIATQVP